MKYLNYEGMKGKIEFTLNKNPYNINFNSNEERDD